MIKIFSVEQVRKADAYTIEKEPVASIDLMERAAQACVDWIVGYAIFSTQPIAIVCGPGNNGGDGLAIARLLLPVYEKIKVYIPENEEKYSPDFQVNLERAKKAGISVLGLDDLVNDTETDFSEYLIVDALFGSGLARTPEGIYFQVIEKINKSNAVVISVDIPSGLFADKVVEDKKAVVKADHTLSFQFPKLTFLFPENEFFVGYWHLLPVDLHPDFIVNEPCKHFLLEAEDIKALLKPRPRFAHKGAFGHALLVGGSQGKMGAAVLMSRACLRAGAGLVTAHVPAQGINIMQTAVPEAMASLYNDPEVLSDLPNLAKYTAVGIGPGLGAEKATASMLKLLIQEARVPLVLDADALNILAENKTWLGFLPAGTILTPHLGEFERLAGKFNNHFERLEALKQFCVKNRVNVVLKGAYSVICTSAGECYFNPTGNPGMATGGSGDVLTGIIAALLAQGYMPVVACIVGVYVHGCAGDLAAKRKGFTGLIASDIVDFLPKAFKRFERLSRQRRGLKL